MPPVWAGIRRFYLSTVIILSITQALVGVLMAVTVNKLLSASPPQRTGENEIQTVVATHGGSIALLFFSVLCLGVCRWRERVLAEKLGQNYVFEQRQRLIKTALADPDYRTSLGVTVTRASNDLSAVRNWIAMGLVTMVSAIPLILVVSCALFIQDWRTGLAVLIPLLIVLCVMPFLARLSYQRSRHLRRMRGRMSARIADSVLARESIQVSGAVDRELRALERSSQKVVHAAVNRVVIGGAARASTVMAASACTVAVVCVAVVTQQSSAHVAGVMTLLGVMTAPITDIGRVVELRQSYKAAVHNIAPQLRKSEEIQSKEENQEQEFKETVREAEKIVGLPWKEISGEMMSFHVQGLSWESETESLDDRSEEEKSEKKTAAKEGQKGVSIPDLHAYPGEVIELRALTQDIKAEVVRSIVTTRRPRTVYFEYPSQGYTAESGGSRYVSFDYSRLPGKVRRRLLSCASADMALERGSIKRLISYRDPDVSEEEKAKLIDLFSLREVIESHPRGEKRKIKNNGQPWLPSDIMALKLVRAFLGTPAVVILENVEQVLDPERCLILDEYVRDYPGIVIRSRSVESFPEDQQPEETQRTTNGDSGSCAAPITWNPA